ncbi:MAG TPA: TldD/PmbA family protein, partial [Gaiellaceae bacterium]|nr:TldD/PmbA family protein [Gaiellaceae bacterium]
RELCEHAVSAALGAGASYADARVVVRRAQVVATRNGRVDRLDDAETEGIGVRVLVGGAWGFACDRRLDNAGAEAAAARAVEFAKAAPGGHSRELAPLEPGRGAFRPQVERDPISVPIADKVALCLRAEEGLKHDDVKVTSASVRAQREHKVFVSSEGASIEQEHVECGAGIDALAARDGVTQIRSYPSAHGGSSAQAGWEYVEGLGLEREAPSVGEQAAALLRADVCPSGITTVVIDAEQMALQVHESVGHPTELDRVYGTEAAYAGTSFLKAGDLGSLRYGSEHMNITADSTTAGGLGTFGFDDEGVPAAREPVVREGVLSGFLTSRETAARIGSGSGGSMRADSWSRMPLVRMTNLHLEPGEGSRDELIAGVAEGVFFETNKSWSIDDKRLNFQFGTQVAWEIRDGELGRMLRDATYTGQTPVFWGSLDGVGGPDEWRLHGLTNCGKGQPGQHAHVSHGAAPARFRNVQVGFKQ